MRTKLLVLLLALCLRPAPANAASRVDFTSALEYAAAHPPITSVIIASPDSILAEGYWRGGKPNRNTNVKSVSKSVLSALVGIALERGELESLDTPISTWFPEHEDLFADRRRARIRLVDLLTMRSGLETTSFYNYGAWVSGSNWVRGQLRMPMEFEPGTQMRYSTGASHLVSVILERATGVRPSTYAARHLFGPIGVKGVGWDRDPQGHDFGGNNLAMTPRQMVRFGQLYLSGGKSGDRQVLPAQWIRDAWRTKTRSHWNGYGYGYFWWFREFAGTPVYYAWGHGGQRVLVLPEEELVVVVTAGLPANGRSRSNVNRVIDRMLVEHVIRADTGSLGPSSGTH